MSPISIGFSPNILHERKIPLSEDHQNMSGAQLDAQISATENAISSSTGVDPNPKPEKAGLFDHARDQELTAKLSKVHDRAEAKGNSVIADKTVPAKADTLDEAFERTWEHINSSPAEKATLKNASDLVTQVRENAKRFGVELSDEQAFRAAMDLEKEQTNQAANEHLAGADHLKAAFKDSTPAESAKWVRDVRESFDRDPVYTLAYLAEQAGMHPAQVAAQMYQRYAGQPMQQQAQPQYTQAQVEQHVQGIIDQVAPTLPDFGRHEDDIVELLTSGAVKRTGNPEKDLRNAWKEAARRDAKLTADEKLDKSLRRTYDRANRRGS
jgi:hypothetical protein